MLTSKDCLAIGFQLGVLENQLEDAYVQEERYRFGLQARPKESSVYDFNSREIKTLRGEEQFQFELDSIRTEIEGYLPMIRECSDAQLEKKVHSILWRAISNSDIHGARFDANEITDIFDDITLDLN